MSGWARLLMKMGVLTAGVTATMSDVVVTHIVDGETKESVRADPDFVDVLLNVSEVSVDGEIFAEVEQVRYKQ